MSVDLTRFIVSASQDGTPASDGKPRCTPPGCLKIVFWCATSGGLATLAMAPFQWPLMSYLSLWPLFYLGYRLRNSLTGLLAAGLLSSFFCSWFAFHWFVLTIQNFGDPGLIGAAAIFLPLALIFQFKFVVFVVAFGFSQRHHLPGWFFAAIIGTVADLFTPNLFPWYWGNLLAGNLWLAQLAEFVGPGGLTFVLFSISYTAYDSWSAFRRGGCTWKWKSIRWLAAATVILLLIGGGRFYQWRQYQQDLPTLRVALVQTNAPLEITNSAGQREPRVEAAAVELMRTTIPDLVTAAKLAAANHNGRPLDLVVLPESAVPYFSTDDHYLNRRYQIYHKDYRALAETITAANAASLNEPAHQEKTRPALLLNEVNFRVHEFQDSGRIRARAHNSATLFVDGKRAAEYHKHRLLPFGEYAPGEGLWQRLGLTQYLPQILQNSRFHPGDRAQLRTLRIPLHPGADHDSHLQRDSNSPETVSILPTICYEVIFSGYVRDFLNSHPENQAAGLLVNLTQDGWYGDTIETYQHFELARLRSIETRRALVRANNTGVSGFVDLTGAYMSALNADTAPEGFGDRGVLVQDVPIQSDYVTLYLRIGHWWFLFPVFAAGWIIARRLGSRRR